MSHGPRAVTSRGRIWEMLLPAPNIPPCRAPAANKLPVSCCLSRWRRGRNASWPPAAPRAPNSPGFLLPSIQKSGKKGKIVVLSEPRAWEDPSPSHPRDKERTRVLFGHCLRFQGNPKKSVGLWPYSCLGWGWLWDSVESWNHGKVQGGRDLKTHPVPTLGGA